MHGLFGSTRVLSYDFTRKYNAMMKAPVECEKMKRKELIRGGERIVTVAGSRYGDSVMRSPQGMDSNIIAARYMACWGIALAR